MTRFLAIAAALATLAIASPASAQAGRRCRNISVTALAFGNYDVFNATPTDSAGSITYRCSNGLSPTVTISLGLAPSGGQRRMSRSGGGDWLAYDIFVDAARTTVWSSTPVPVATGGTRTIPYYARTYALQDVSVGAYTDTLVVTFNF